jgi:hypothetical protein
MAYYATIEDVRKRGFPPPSPTDSEIDFALGMSMEMIDLWCGLRIEKQNEVEISVDGNNGDRMIFGIKIRFVHSLTIDGNVIPPESIVNYPENFNGEIALKDGYIFKEGKKNVVLSIMTGYIEVPFAVREASAHLSAMILNRQIFAGRPEIPELKSESLLDYSRTRFSYEEVNGIIEQDPYLFGLLRPYRLKGAGV